MTKRPILISMWSSRVLPDSLQLGIWPRTQLLLQPPDNGRGIPFVRAAADARYWRENTSVRIGRSVTASLHPIALAAVAEICRRQSSRPLRECIEENGAPFPKPARDLAEWFLACVSEALLTESQLSYLFASGAYRARAISTMLQTIGKRNIAHLVDVGTGVGLIPWLLCAESNQMRSVELFEPRKTGRTALRRLWSYKCFDQRYTLAHDGGDDVPFSTPADLILFCHCLFHIQDRRSVLRRAWQALKPGGVLVVNETPREAGGADRRRYALLERNEIVSLVPGMPRLFMARTGWRMAHDPYTGSARVMRSSGLFVSVKD